MAHADLLAAELGLPQPATRGVAPVDHPHAPSDLLSTVQHGLKVLEAVGANEGVCPKALAATVGLNLATTYHLVNTLVHEGYVRRSAGGGLCLGDRLINLLERVDQRQDQFPELRPLCEELARRAGDVAVVGRLIGPQVVISQARAVPGAVHAGSIVAGLRGPAHTMALGKVLVAGMETVSGLVSVRSWILTPLTDRTITDIDTLLAELELTRRRGFAVDIEEGQPGLSCIAAPIATPPDRPRAAIAVAVSTDRLRSDPGRLISDVVSAGRRASAILAAGSVAAKGG